MNKVDELDELISRLGFYIDELNMLYKIRGVSNKEEALDNVVVFSLHKKEDNDDN